MNELISVIVPVYNAERTLHRCVSALIEQTYQNIEIILINDGSKDGSLEICRQFELEDPRIRVFDKANGGVSSARNAGLDIACGEFAMFCDSDDWAEPDWCEELITHYEEGCLVMCGHYVEGEQPYLPYEIKAEGDCERYPRNGFVELKLKNFNAPWNKLYSMAVIKAQELRFHEHLTNGEDYLFILQYLDCIAGEIVLLNKCVFHYEWPREYSLSKRVPEDYLAQCCMLTANVLHYAERLGVDDPREMRQIHTDLFHEFQKIVISTVRRKKLSPRDQIAALSAVMSAAEYQRCAAEANISPNRFYTWLARRTSGLGIWLWYQIRR